MSEAPSMRDMIAEAVEKVEVKTAEPSATETQTPSTAAERARDEAGRFAKQEGKEQQPQQAEQKPEQQPSAKQRPSYPSHWKRDYQPLWDKVPDDLLPMLEYAGIQREQEYQKGVSTYKQEADRARGLMEAITPFVPLLQQHGIQPETWISNLGNAHRVLATASPQEKIQMFAKLAQDYKVPLEYLLNPQALQALQSIPQPQQQPDVGALIEQKLSQRESQQAVDAFVKQAPEKYPHFNEVREKMVGFLQSEMAQDLESAYKMAIRLDDGLWQKQQEEDKKAAEAERQRQAQEAAAKAKRQTVSPRSATPSVTTGAKGDNKELRGQYAEAINGLGGRV